MSQYEVLVAIYRECKDDPSKRFSSKDIVNVVSKKVDANETSIKRSIGVLVYWSFLKRTVDKSTWKDNYTITPRGIDTAMNIERYYPKA